MPPTLTDRLNEVMKEMRWEYADLVRVSGESRSVVSQWLGRSSKVIKTIGKLEAAKKIEDASGYAALWVAKGMGPKMVARSRPSLVAVVTRPGDAPESVEPAALADALERLGAALAAAPVDMREAVATNLAGWARDGGKEHWRQVVLQLLDNTSGKRQGAA